MESIRKSKRINEEAQARNTNSGRFENTCGSLIHNPLNEDSETLIDLVKRPRIKGDDYKALISKGIVDHETKYICKSCFSVIKFHNIYVFNKSDNAEAECDENPICENEAEDNEELITKCINLGKEIRESIISDSKGITNVESVSDLKDFDSINWLTNRPVALVHLLCSISNIDINTASRTKVIIISKVVELIYYTLNSKKVLPNHFLENLLCYTFTNCKSYLTFLVFLEIDVLEVLIPT